MNNSLTPETWRSEAFAEDLFTEVEDSHPRRDRWLSALLGLLPVALATAGALLATLTGGA